MEEYQKVLVKIFLRLKPLLFIIFNLKQLRPDVFESPYISRDCSDACVHLDDLLEYKLFLSLFHEGHDFGAVQNEILLLLHFKIFGLFQVV